MSAPKPLRGLDVVILAGGEGRRIRAVAGEVPKPLLLVAERPFLAHLLEQVRGHGAARAVLALGHRAEAFGPFLREGVPAGLAVAASVEKTPLGTGGALRAALPHLRTRTLLAMNGDSYAAADLGTLVEAHRRLAARLTILLARVPDAARFGRVEAGPDGAVTAFREKGEAGEGLVSAGVYVLEREVIEGIPAGRPVSLEREVFPSAIGHRFHAVAGDFPFLDIGTPDSYGRADRFFREGPPRHGH